MQTGSRTNRRVEFGDFQTPPFLARQVCQVLGRHIPQPAAVVEPTCGRGSFLVAALEFFPSIRDAIGLEINPAHAMAARSNLGTQSFSANWEIRQEDFFGVDWNSVLRRLPEPLLVVGNPPWVTNAAVGALRGSNLPKKSNFQKHTGLDAVTGKSNFDVSEWMLVQLIEALRGRRAVLAMLCKTAVARKVLFHAWKNDLPVRAEMRFIDAQRHFGASVDACLLVCDIGGAQRSREADIFSNLITEHRAQSIGLRDGRVVADLEAFERTRHLAGRSPLRWRSGIKHDCARVMEFHRVGDRFQNGLGEVVELEDDYLYPALKSSHVASGRVGAPNRWMLVTQRKIGDDTRVIEERAPKTWNYLQRNGDRLDRRASSIYRGRPRFSIFGVGEYTLASYKVAVSALYKRLSFAQVGPHFGKPVVLDDTCLFLACQTQSEAAFVHTLLSSEEAQTFYAARIFWDAKRPITAEILNQLSLLALARTLDADHPLTAQWEKQSVQDRSRQPTLF